MDNRIYIDKIIDSILEAIEDGIKASAESKEIIKAVINIIDDHKELMSLMAVYTLDAYYSTIICNKIDTVENPIYDMVGGVLMSRLF